MEALLATSLLTSCSIHLVGSRDGSSLYIWTKVEFLYPCEVQWQLVGASTIKQSNMCWLLFYSIIKLEMPDHYTYMCVCACMYTYTYMCKYICIYVHTYIYVYVYVYIHIFFLIASIIFQHSDYQTSRLWPNNLWCFRDSKSKGPMFT